MLNNKPRYPTIDTVACIMPTEPSEAIKIAANSQQKDPIKIEWLIRESCMSRNSGRISTK
jgi:hypothetical protein